MLNSIWGGPFRTGMQETHTPSKPTPFKKGKQSQGYGGGQELSVILTNRFKYSLFSSNVAGIKCLSVHRKFSGIGTAILGLKEGQQNTRQASVFQGSRKDAKLDSAV